MALSNWDTLAFDYEGKPCTGVIENDKGASVEIYKNWIYVRDPKMWQKDSGWVEPTIAKIDSGSVLLAGFEIRAVRGPQNAVFCFIEWSNYEEKTKGWMAGIGASGFDSPVDRMLAHIGKARADFPEGTTFTTGSGFDGEDDEYLILWPMAKECGQIQIRGSKAELEALDSKWTGVTAETLKEFHSWLDKLADDDYWDDDKKEWLEKIKSAEALRFCQGDGFFAANLDTDICATPVGEAEQPMMMQMLKGSAAQEEK